jgi:hypothetical protein
MGEVIAVDFRKKVVLGSLEELDWDDDADTSPDMVNTLSEEDLVEPGGDRDNFDFLPRASNEVDKTADITARLYALNPLTGIQEVALGSGPEPFYVKKGIEIVHLILAYPVGFGMHLLNEMELRSDNLIGVVSNRVAERVRIENGRDRLEYFASRIWLHDEGSGEMKFRLELQSQSLAPSLRKMKKVFRRKIAKTRVTFQLDGRQRTFPLKDSEDFEDQKGRLW